MRKHLIIISVIYLFVSCNSAKSEKIEATDSSQSANITTDSQTEVTNIKKPETLIPDTIFFKNCHNNNKTDSLLNIAPVLGKALNTYKSDVYQIIISGEDFCDAYNELDNDNYDYLGISFTKKDPFTLFAEGFNLQSTNPHSPIRSKPTSKRLSFTSTMIVRKQSWWVRPAIICKEAAKEFINKLNAEGIDLIKKQKEYNVLITPTLSSDDYGQYIALILSVQKNNADKSISGTTLKANPCPKCNY